MERDSRIYVAGHSGLAGSAIVRRLRAEGFGNLVLRTHAELDLEDQAAVRAFFESERPEYVFLAAARVGGIHANNTYPAEFVRSNLAIELNVFDSAYRAGVKKLMFLGSSCIYPKLAPQPLKEEYLLTGPLEPTNQAYAIAKIAGIELCRSYHRQYGANYVSVMPTNLYGPGDRFDLENAHVLPALLRKVHEAKLASVPSVMVWGSGNALREFLHADDMAGACVFLMRTYDSPDIINIGCGEDLMIRELAEMIVDVVGYQGELVFDRSKPDGTPRKLLDVSKLTALGWAPTIALRDGIRETYGWYLSHIARPAPAAPALA